MKPVPGPLVTLVTMFAPKIRSVAFVVVAEPLLLVVLLPVFAAVTSTGVFGSAPLYSRMRMSGYAAAFVKVTVTVLAPGSCRRDVLRVIDRLRERATDCVRSHR